MAPRRPEDHPQADGCDLDFTEDPDDEITAALRPLFPKGEVDKKKASRWRELFG